MQYSYKVSDALGRIETGKTAADSREQLFSLLKSQGKVVLEVKVAPSLENVHQSGNLSAQERLNFTQQLGGLLSAGIPIERALTILERLGTGKQIGVMVQKITRSLREGHSFTSALEMLHSFPSLYISMVRAGEAGGVLPEVLNRLARYLEEEIALRRYLVSSLIYPAIVVVASVAALIYFVSDVLPKFQDIFAGIGSELPLLTRIVMGVGHGLTRFWWLIPLLGGGIALLVVQQYMKPEGKLAIDRFLLRLPLIGPILNKTAVSNMAMALSLLERSGVSLLEGLEITAAIVNNAVFAGALRETGREIKAGHTMADSMARQQVFPLLAVEMIGVGEESGNLSEMLNEVAKTYETEVKNALGIFLAVFEPAIILIMVVVIAILAIAILLPIVNLNTQFNAAG